MKGKERREEEERPYFESEFSSALARPSMNEEEWPGDWMGWLADHSPRSIFMRLLDQTCISSSSRHVPESKTNHRTVRTGPYGAGLDWTGGNLAVILISGRLDAMNRWVRVADQRSKIISKERRPPPWATLNQPTGRMSTRLAGWKSTGEWNSLA